MLVRYYHQFKEQGPAFCGLLRIGHEERAWYPAKSDLDTILDVSLNLGKVVTLKIFVIFCLMPLRPSYIVA